MNADPAHMALNALRILGADHLAGDDPCTALALVAIGIAKERDTLRDRVKELESFVDAMSDRLATLSLLLTRYVNKEQP